MNLRLRIFAPLIVALMLANGAHAQNAAPPAAGTSQAKPAPVFHDFNLSEAACKAKDGMWGYGGAMPRPGSKPFCSLPGPNAGKPCASSKECNGTACVAGPSTQVQAGSKNKVVGVCEKYQIGGGCRTAVEGGVVRQTVCYD